MILRIDDTDVERNTQASLDSIFDGLRWLGPGLGRRIPPIRPGGAAPSHGGGDFREGAGVSRFHAGLAGERKSRVTREGPWLFNAGMRELSTEESDRRAAAGEPFVLRYRVPRGVRRRRGGGRSGLRASDQGRRRHRGFRAAALQRRADLSHGLLRGRRRSENHPHPARAGAPGQHLQAHSDFRGARFSAAAVRASAAADRAGRLQAFEAQARAGGQRHHLSRTPGFCRKPS